jgi:hypothetical protein
VASGALTLATGATGGALDCGGTTTGALSFGGAPHATSTTVTAAHRRIPIGASIACPRYASFMRRIVVVLAAAAMVIACSAVSGSGRGFGDGCDNDVQCGSPLTCRSALVNGLCTVNKSCTITCSQDSDCQAQDPKGRCFQGCNEKVCLKTP